MALLLRFSLLKALLFALLRSRMGRRALWKGARALGGRRVFLWFVWRALKSRA